MPPLPPVVWGAAGAAVLLLLGLCAATAYAVLRAPTRARIASWPRARIFTLLVVVALPWLIVRLAPIRISANIDGLVQLIGWLLLALAAFAFLVLLPIAAVLCAVAWWLGWRRRTTRESPGSDALSPDDR